MQLKSSAFENNEQIPARYTCDQQGSSPPLSWQGVPDEAETLALVVDDPDAPSGTFTHWIVYNLPTTPSELKEGVSLSDRFSEGLREGLNSYGNQGYGPPCPPRGDEQHHYVFRLYALKRELNFSGRVTRDQLMDAINGKVIEEADLVGLYSRS